MTNVLGLATMECWKRIAARNIWKTTIGSGGIRRVPNLVGIRHPDRRDNHSAHYFPLNSMHDYAKIFSVKSEYWCHAMQNRKFSLRQPFIFKTIYCYLVSQMGHCRILSIEKIPSTVAWIQLLQMLFSRMVSWIRGVQWEFKKILIDTRRPL